MLVYDHWVKLHRLCLACAAVALAQTPNAPPAVVAGVPVNYDEAQAGYSGLPEVLKLSSGQPVRDAKTWRAKRRPEILRLYEQHQFGRSPAKPAHLSFNLFDPGTPAFNGAALRKQVTVHFSADKSGPKMDLLIYTPAHATKPVPLLLNISFTANSSTVDDPGVKPGEVWNREKKRVPATQNRVFRPVDVPRLLAQGLGFATVYYGDIDPDFDGGLAHGVRSLYPPPTAGDWGAIAAWGWGLSRALDYLETDRAIDSKRVGIMGISRLGKTVLWAGARDERFALVIASCSGEGGAALARRNYGENIKHMGLRFGYQFAPAYQTWGDRVQQWPVDSHMLISLIAPRPLLLQTGDTDLWSDPRGEFLGAVEAGPVYRLLGQQDLGTTVMPKPGQALLNTLGYYEHAGGHGTLPGDWDQFVAFLEKHLLASRSRRR